MTNRRTFIKKSGLFVAASTVPFKGNQQAKQMEYDA